MSRLSRHFLSLILAGAVTSGFAAHAAAQEFVPTSTDPHGSLFVVPQSWVEIPTGTTISYTGGVTVTGAGFEGGTITESGSGLIMLSGPNSFNDGTTISTEGTLIITDTNSMGAPSGAVLVGAPATLGGTITLSAGTPIIGGSLTLQIASGLTLLSGTIISNGTGTLTENGVLSDTTDIRYTGTSEFLIKDKWQPYQGSIYASDHSLSLGGQGSDGSNKPLSAVPEPSTWAMMAAGLLVLAGWRRVKRA